MSLLSDDLIEKASQVSKNLSQSAIKLIESFFKYALRPETGDSNALALQYENGSTYEISGDEQGVDFTAMSAAEKKQFAASFMAEKIPEEIREDVIHGRVSAKSKKGNNHQRYDMDTIERIYTKKAAEINAKNAGEMKLNRPEKVR